jgi:hypothetical protein
MNYLDAMPGERCCRDMCDRRAVGAIAGKVGSVTKREPVCRMHLHEAQREEAARGKA